MTVVDFGRSWQGHVLPHVRPHLNRERDRATGILGSWEWRGLKNVPWLVKPWPIISDGQRSSGKTPNSGSQVWTRKHSAFGLIVVS